MSKLLPCPFCGSDAVKTWSKEYGDCAHCGNDECAASAFYDRVMVSEWNTRHTPDGWQMVPVDPTLEMQKAYFDSIDEHMRRVQTDLRFGRFDNQRLGYRRMLAAAPTPGRDPA